MNTEKKSEYIVDSCNDPIETDILVCGGGPSGFAAAVAAGRSGQRVLLIEQQGTLGGVATSGMVAVLLGGFSRGDNRRRVVGGIYGELLERLDARKGHNLKGVADYVDIEAMKLVCDEMAVDAGVRILFFSTVFGARSNGSLVSEAYVANKGGMTVVRPKVVIDCTGDADIACTVGCPVALGRPEDLEYPGEMAPATVRCLMTGVDTDAVAEYVQATGDRRFRAIVSRLIEEGKWPEEFAFDMLCMEPSDWTMGLFQPNIIRQVGVDGTDPHSVTAAMMEGRRFNDMMTEILRKHVPGFKRAKLVATAPVVGIRETRRIIGNLLLSESHLESGAQFPDTIGLSGYGWDLPHPRRPSYQEKFGSWKSLPGTHINHEKIEIPYRCLLPRKIDNLIVAGRAISVEYHALGPVRVMAPCMATGHAAGNAAALAMESLAAGELPVFTRVDTEVLRSRLTDQGAILT